MPPQKIQRLQESLDTVGGCPHVSAKQIASLVGNVMSIALGPVARLMTWSLYTLLNNRHSWYERLLMSPEAAEELQFWHKCIFDFMARTSGEALQLSKLYILMPMIQGLVVTWWSIDPR